MAGTTELPDLRESNKRVMHDWLVETILPILKPEGMWIAPDPAPLLASDIEGIFERIAAHRNYERQLLISDSLDGCTVMLRDGRTQITRKGGDNA